MAIDLIGQGTSGHPARDYVKNAYKIEATIDIADAVTEKGSAIVATDVLEVIQLPAGTQLIGGGIQVVTPTTSVTTTTSFDFGYGGNTDVIADGVSIMAAGYGAVGSNGALDRSARFSSADTLDIVVASAPSAGITDGVVRVYAIVVDIT